MGLEGAFKESIIMIVKNHDIRKFLPKLKDKDYFEAIYLLNEEATKAERELLKSNSRFGRETDCTPEYVEGLKKIICYLRYGVKSRGFPKECIHLLDCACAQTSTK